MQTKKCNCIPLVPLLSMLSVTKFPIKYHSAVTVWRLRRKMGENIVTVWTEQASFRAETHRLLVKAYGEQCPRFATWQEGRFHYKGERTVLPTQENHRQWIGNAFQWKLEPDVPGTGTGTECAWNQRVETLEERMQPNCERKSNCG